MKLAQTMQPLSLLLLLLLYVILPVRAEALAVEIEQDEDFSVESDENGEARDLQFRSSRPTIPPFLVPVMSPSELYYKSPEPTDIPRDSPTRFPSEYFSYRPVPEGKPDYTDAPVWTPAQYPSEYFTYRPVSHDGEYTDAPFWTPVDSPFQYPSVHHDPDDKPAILYPTIFYSSAWPSLIQSPVFHPTFFGIATQAPVTLLSGEICNDGESVEVPGFFFGAATATYDFYHCSNYRYHYDHQAKVYEVLGTGDIFHAQILNGGGSQVHVSVYYHNCEEYEDLVGDEENEEREEFGRGRSQSKSIFARRSPSNVETLQDYSYGYNACVPNQGYTGARWATTVGEKYTIIVHPSYRYSRELDSYVLSISKHPSAVLCEASKQENSSQTVLEPEDLGTVSVSTETISVIGPLQKAYLLNGLPFCDYTLDSEALAYKFTVSDTNVLVSLVAEGNVQVYLYYGDCDVGWTCWKEESEEYRYDNSKIEWENQVSGREYLAVLSTCCGGEQELQDYRLSLNVTSIGNVCDDKVDVSLSSDTTVIVTDSLANKTALVLPTTYCGYYGRGLGTRPVALYAFRGNNENMIISLASETSYTHQFLLYSAYSCEDILRCLAFPRYNRGLSQYFSSRDTYYVAVFSEFGSVEEFSLSFEPLVYGDICEESIQLGSVTNETFRIMDSTENASFFDSLQRACYYYSITSKTRLYEFDVPGSGLVSARVRRKTDEYLSEEEVLKDLFTPQLGVLKSSCFRPSCVEYTYNGWQEGYYTISWNSEGNSTYLLAVYANEMYDSGEFELEIEFTEFGNVCDDAVDIQLTGPGEVVIEGSVRDGKGQYALAYCQARGVISPPVIYSFTVAEDMWATVSLDYSGQSSFFDVFAVGDEGYEIDPDVFCQHSAFECIRVHRGQGGENSWSWLAESGKKYFMAISTYSQYVISDGEAQFTLTVSVPESGDVCTDSVDIGVLPAEGLIISNTTEDGVIYSLDACSYYHRRDEGTLGVVYSFVARKSGQLSAESKFESYGFNLQSSLYQGECGALECVFNSNSYWDRSSTWEVEEGSRYYLYVSGRSASENGDFVLYISHEGSKDVCEDMETVGSLTSETDVVEFATFETTEKADTSLLPICYNSLDSAAAAFSVTVGENGVLSLLAWSSSFTAYVSLYQGTCGEELDCVGDYASSGGVSVAVEEGASYVAVVHGCCGSNVVGDFNLRLSLGGSGDSDGIDTCEESTELNHTDPEEAMMAFGSTSESATAPIVLDCPRSYMISSPSVIYSYSSSFAGMATVSVRAFGTSRYFTPYIMVSGGSCGSLTCISEPSYRGHVFRDYSWEVTAGEQYHLIVHSSQASSHGEFMMRISYRKEGDLCADPVDLGVLGPGETIFDAGSTSDNSLYYKNLAGCRWDETQVSALYKLKSSSGRITATVSGYEFTPQFAVLKGSCSDSAFECISYRSYSEVSWDANEGEEFFVAVSGGDALGDFVLKLESLPTSDPCSDATDLGLIAPGGSTVLDTSSAIGLYNNFTYCTSRYYGENYFSPGMAALFKLRTSGGRFTANVGGGNWYYVSMSVLHGECGNLVCEDTVSLSNQVQWNASVGKDYYLLVYNIGENVDFFLSIEEVPIGDVCEDSEDLGVIAESDLFVRGDTIGEMFFGLPSCYYTISSPTKVYSVTYSSPQRVHVTIDGDDFDGHVHVYKGQAPLPVTVNGDYFRKLVERFFSRFARRLRFRFRKKSEEDSSSAPVVDESVQRCMTNITCTEGHSYRSVEFDAEAGVKYYVAVFGCCGSNVVGTFFLRFQAAPRVSACEMVQPLVFDKGVGRVEVFGSTEDGFFLSRSKNCWNGLSSRVVMYAFEGTGEYMVASVSTVGRKSHSAYMLISSSDCNAAVGCDRYEYDQSSTWKAEKGLVYYVFVFACCGGSTSFVDYRLSIETQIVGDICEDSVDLGTLSPVGIDVEGASNSTGIYPSLRNCTYMTSDLPMSLYSFVGTGDTAIANISGAIDWRHRDPFVVLSGDCTNPMCLFNSWHDNVLTWQTEPGVRYYFAFVPSSSRPSYSIRVDTIVSVPLCEANRTDYGSVPEGGFVVKGDIATGRTVDELSSCYSMSGQVDVFTIIGNGDAYLFSVLSSYFSFTMVILTGPSCGETVCSNHTYSYQHVLHTDVGETYSVIVGDCCMRGATGKYEIDVSSIPVADVDSDFEVIDDFDELTTMQGSNDDGVFVPDLPYCNSNGLSSPAKLYRLTVVGDSQMKASVTGFGGMNARVSVYEIVEGSYDCLPSTTYYSYGREHAWAAVNGATYLIVVQGCCGVGSTGDFILRIEKTASSSIGASCESAPHLGRIVDSRLVSGTTAVGFDFNGHGNETSVGCDYPYYYYWGSTKTLMYKVTGTGSRISASVFLPSSYRSDVGVVVFEGECGAFSCVPTGRYGGEYRSFAWLTEENKTYTVVVSSCCGDYNQGNEFVLTLVTLDNEISESSMIDNEVRGGESVNENGGGFKDAGSRAANQYSDTSGGNTTVSDASSIAQLAAGDAGGQSSELPSSTSSSQAAEGLPELLFVVFSGLVLALA